MTNRTVYMPDVDERYTVITHRSGLTVCLSNKDFNTSYAVLGVGFGSLFENCAVNGKVYTFPDGTAHFLEHKMFENPDGEDTFLKFSRVGAEANAYTGPEQTCYLFSLPDHTEDALEILMKSILSPFFTQKSVNSEKSIVIEELKMYRDDPEETVRNALLHAMYKNNRVQKNICGTVTSVKRITAESLFEAYNLFYTPSNMVLSLCGKFDKEKVCTILDRLLPACPAAPCARTVLPKEHLPCRCFKNRVTVYENISIPAVAVGIMGTTGKTGAEERLKRFYAMCLIAHALFSRSGEFVSGLVKDNLIPDDPSYETVHNAYRSYIVFESSAYDPREFFRRFDLCTRKIRTEGIAKLDFERGKKALYADFLENFNSSEGCAHLYLSDLFEELDTAKTGRCIFSLSLEEVNAAARELLSDDRLCRLTALSLEQKKSKERNTFK